MTRVEKFKVYMDWFITHRAWILTEKPFNNPSTYTFDEFIKTKSKQTNMTLLDEWVWKWGDRL